MKRIKILMYSTILGNGGAEKAMLNVINNINLEKFMVTLVIARKNGNDYLNQLKKSKWIKYINLGTQDDEDDKIFGLLSKIIEEENPDICFAPGIFTNFILMDALEQIDYKGKIILRESGYVSARNLSEEAKNKLIRQYRKSDAIISISKGIKKDLVQNYYIKKGKIIVINNLVEIDKVIKKASSEKEDKEFLKIEGPKIITVGRLETVKNQKMLLNSFKDVKKQIPTAKLIILGQGTLEKELKNLSRSLKIDDSVYFMGFKENPYYYVKNSDIFALTSLTEGFGNVIIEAMALKVPVICSNCPTGPKEILKNGKYGYLVKLDDEKNLTKKIIELINKPSKRKKMAELGFRRVKKCFDTDIIVSEYESLFEKIGKQ